MSDRGYLQFSALEIGGGLRYAFAHYETKLSAEVLRIIANETRKLMYTDERTFEDARHQIMSLHLTQRTPEEKKRYEAYEGALGKMFNARRQYALSKKAAPKKARAKRTVKGVSTDLVTGQREWII